MPDNSGITTVNATDDINGMVPQPHGGALRRGGKPGNRGGTGRPPGVVKSWSRKVYEDVLRELERRLAEAGEPLTIEQLTAIGSMAGRYGGLSEDKTATVNVLVPAPERERRVQQIVAQAVARMRDQRALPAAVDADEAEVR